MAPFALVFPAAVMLVQAPGTGVTKVNPAQSPEAVAQRHVDAYNTQNLNALLNTLDLDVKLYLFPDKLQVQGKTDCAAAMRDLFSGAPDLRMEVTERMVAGSRVIDHLWIKGRPDGRLIRGVQIYEVRNGAIVGIWFMVD